MAKADLDRLSVLAVTSVSSPISSPRRKFWLWPHLLSLDAVFVALLWQQLFASAVAVHITLRERAALGLAVWIIYVCDRLFDARAESGLPSARHQFYARRRSAASLLIQMAVAGEIVVVCGLDRQLVMWGLLLSAAVGCYFFCIHFQKRLKQLLPKEAAVASIFAAGTALVPLSRAGVRVEMLVACLLFAALCFLNCVSIECFESTCFGAAPVSRLRSWTAWPGMHLGLLLLAIFSTSLLGLFTTSAGELYGSLAVAAIASIGFDKSCRFLSPNQMRVSADLPLMLPVLFVLARRYGL